MKFVVEMVYPGIFNNGAPRTRVEEFSHAVDAIRYVRDQYRFFYGYPNWEIFSYKITLVKE